MRTFGLVFSCAVLATLVTAAGCTPAPTTMGSAKKDGSSSKKKSSSKEASNDSDDDDDDGESTSQASTSGTTGANNGGTVAPQASKFACSGAGIAAFADALVNAGRKSCTSEGTGVVRNDNYQCVKTAIDSVGPAHPDTAYGIVTTLLAPNQQFPNLECTYFIQMVTSGVCGEPLSPSDMKWQDYPLAHEFINKAPAGWKWFANNGTNQAAIGDIFVYDSMGGDDPGHIMIVAEALSGGKFRIAEANELNADGSAATQETGVMSNTRVTSLTDPDRRPAGWFRLAK